MAMRQLLNPASILNEYPKEEHAVYAVIEQRMQQAFLQDVGHAFLYTPKPGEWWPVMQSQAVVRLDLQPLRVSRVPLVLNNVYVHADRRGEGIGQRLVRQALKYAQEKDLPVVLRAQPFRTRRMNVYQLMEWYSKLGFIMIGLHNENHYMAWCPEP